MLRDLGMGARRYEDLVVWRLSRQLKLGVFEFTARSPARYDRKFCDQIRDSSRSATRNIAEGFGRFGPREFARYLTIALGSLHETKDHLLDAYDRTYLDGPTHERLRRLALRAIKAGNRLLRYLRSADPPSDSPSSP